MTTYVIAICVLHTFHDMSVQLLDKRRLLLWKDELDRLLNESA